MHLQNEMSKNEELQRNFKRMKDKIGVGSSSESRVLEQKNYLVRDILKKVLNQVI